MKCPHCKAELQPAKNGEDKLFCPRCGFIYLNKVKDDPNLSCEYDYKILDAKFENPQEVFDKAVNKFDNGRREVVGIRINRGHYSLFHGQEFTVIYRKK